MGLSPDMAVGGGGAELVSIDFNARKAGIKTSMIRNAEQHRNKKDIIGESRREKSHVKCLSNYLQTTFPKLGKGKSQEEGTKP